MPLQAIQALLPLFRVDSIRSKDATYYFGGRKSIIFCVPAVDARVGAPYTSAQGMASAATVRGAEVLRRELQQVADPHMHDIRVVIADVGVIGSAKAISVWGSLESSVQSWTPGEQKVYGSPYTTFLSAIGQRTRASSSIKLFVKTIVQTVGKNALKGERVSTFAVGLRLWSHRFLQEFRGARFSVGAGGLPMLHLSFTTVLTLLFSYRIYSSLLLTQFSPRCSSEPPGYYAVLSRQSRVHADLLCSNW